MPLQGDVKKAVSISQSALFAEPSHEEARNELATLMMQQEEHEASSALLSTVSPASGQNARQSATALALRSAAETLGSDSENESWKLAQKAVFLCPSDAGVWASAVLAASTNP